MRFILKLLAMLAGIFIPSTIASSYVEEKAELIGRSDSNFSMELSGENTVMLLFGKFARIADTARFTASEKGTLKVIASENFIMEDGAEFMVEGGSIYIGLDKMTVKMEPNSAVRCVMEYMPEIEPGCSIEIKGSKLKLGNSASVMAYQSSKLGCYGSIILGLLAELELSNKANLNISRGALLDIGQETYMSISKGKRVGIAANGAIIAGPHLVITWNKTSVDEGVVVRLFAGGSEGDNIGLVRIVSCGEEFGVWFKPRNQNDEEVTRKLSIHKSETFRFDEAHDFKADLSFSSRKSAYGMKYFFSGQLKMSSCTVYVDETSTAQAEALNLRSGKIFVLRGSRLEGKLSVICASQKMPCGIKLTDNSTLAFSALTIIDNDYNTTSQNISGYEILVKNASNLLRLKDELRNLSRVNPETIIRARLNEEFRCLFGSSVMRKFAEITSNGSVLFMLAMGLRSVFVAPGSSISGGQIMISGEKSQPSTVNVTYMDMQENSSLICHPGAQIRSNGAISFDVGSRMELRSHSNVTVKKGSRLRFGENAEVNIANGSSFIVGEGTNIAVANLTLVEQCLLIATDKAATTYVGYKMLVCNDRNFVGFAHSLKQFLFANSYDLIRGWIHKDAGNFEKISSEAVFENKKNEKVPTNFCVTRNGSVFVAPGSTFSGENLLAICNVPEGSNHITVSGGSHLTIAEDLRMKNGNIEISRIPGKEPGKVTIKSGVALKAGSVLKCRSCFVEVFNFTINGTLKITDLFHPRRTFASPLKLTSELGDSAGVDGILHITKNGTWTSHFIEHFMMKKDEAQFRAKQAKGAAFLSNATWEFISLDSRIMVSEHFYISSGVQLTIKRNSSIEMREDLNININLVVGPGTQLFCAEEFHINTDWKEKKDYQLSLVRSSIHLATGYYTKLWVQHFDASRNLKHLIIENSNIDFKDSQEENGRNITFDEAFIRQCDATKTDDTTWTISLNRSGKIIDGCF